MNRTVKQSGITALLGVAGYVLVPLVGLATPALSWDGNGPRFTETALGNVFFGTMHLSLLVGVAAGLVALGTAVLALVRRRSGPGAKVG